MKVIIAGSRSITDYAAVLDAVIGSGFDITEIVSGCAKGVDTIGELIGEINKIPVKKFPANWNRHGKIAGPIRNVQMGDYADALVAVRANGSRGTSHMINYMMSLDKPVYVVDL